MWATAVSSAHVRWFSSTSDLVRINTSGSYSHGNSIRFWIGNSVYWHELCTSPIFSVSWCGSLTRWREVYSAIFGQGVRVKVGLLTTTPSIRWNFWVLGNPCDHLSRWLIADWSVRLFFDVMRSIVFHRFQIFHRTLQSTTWLDSPFSTTKTLTEQATSLMSNVKIQRYYLEVWRLERP